MQRHECNKHNDICINDSIKCLFPSENQGVTRKNHAERSFESKDMGFRILQG
jgi:hypothetical protein